jgi:hypothetical protein
MTERGTERGIYSEINFGITKDSKKATSFGLVIGLVILTGIMKLNNWGTTKATETENATVTARQIMKETGWATKRRWAIVMG